MTDELVEQVRPLAYTVARSVCRRYGTDLADLVSEQMVWLVRHHRQAAEWLDSKDGKRRLMRSMRRYATRYAVKDHAQRTGYQPDDLYWYSLGMLRELLVQLAEGPWDGLSPVGNGEQRGSRRPPSERGDMLAIRADVQRGLARVNDTQQELLGMVGAGMTEREIAEHLGASRPAARMRVQRALRALQEELGGERPQVDPPERRRVMSNAAARAVTDRESGQ